MGKPTGTVSFFVRKPPAVDALEPVDVYQDPECRIPHEQPISLKEDGSAPDIYIKCDDVSHETNREQAPHRKPV